MNILLVDDDVYVTETLQKSIDWASLQIDNVYTAHSVNKAKKIIEDVPIHILVCDIEMPREDGFALLTWIHQKEYIIKSILLTSYAEFEYANRAIKLSCFAYVLKPVDFEQMEITIQKAMEAEKEALKAVDHKKYYEEYWSASEKIKKELFWKELLIENNLKSLPDIQNLINKNSLEYCEKYTFKVAFVEFFIKESGSKDYRKGMFEWNLRNMLSESFNAMHINIEAILPSEEEQLVVVMHIDDTAAILDTANAYMKKVKTKLGIDCRIIIGDIWSIKNASESARKFIYICKNYVIGENEVVLLKSYEQKPMSYQPPDLLLWESFVLNSQEDTLITAVDEYLDALIRKEKLDKEVLKRFVLDYIQMLISVLSQRNVILHNMENPFFTLEQMNDSLRSVSRTKKAMREMLHIVLNMTEQDGRPISIVKRVREYIDQNLEKDITRDSLAKTVFLNQDYLSRIFKKEVGESIGNYIVNKRIEMAKEYLEKTNEQINTIAVNVGYDNFSYFTKVFKNCVGVSPKEYKRAFSKE